MTGIAVVVHITSHAINDFSLDRIQDKASEKYDGNVIEEDGTVSVGSTDFP